MLEKTLLLKDQRIIKPRYFGLKNAAVFFQLFIEFVVSMKFMNFEKVIILNYRLTNINKL